MSLWVWISVGVIVVFVMLIIVISRLKNEYGSDNGGFVGDAIETFKNCCKKIFGQ